MIPRRHRLPTQTFPRTAVAIWRNEWFVLKRASGVATELRLGAVIPAAAVPSAVRRHRLKRRLLSLARASLPPGDYLFIVRKEASYKELKEEFVRMTKVYNKQEALNPNV